jgi:hypothetical protein
MSNDFWEGYVPEPVKPAQHEFVLPGGGYIPAIPAQQALDKKAENARELGLDYEPPCKTGSQCTSKCEQCVVQEPVAFDVTIDGDEAQTLYDQLGDDREDLHPIRIVVGDGHSGYGLYVAQAEYQDEGAVLITSITPPAQPAPVQPVAWAIYQRGRLQSFWLDKGDAYDFEFTTEHQWQPLYTTPPAQRTWVGLSDKEYVHITDTVFHQGRGLVAYYLAIEAKLKELNT